MMKRDIFIDNNIACRFSNPLDANIKELLVWLMDNHTIQEGDEDDRAILVVSNKLLAEYYRSCSGANGATSIPVLVNRLLQEGRLMKISNEQIKEFKCQYFTKKVVKQLQSNIEDRDHIPVVLLSERKLALTQDQKFAADLQSFPGFTVIVSNRPENISYK